jgi:predicted DNA-binding ribbon-helix-helix protein
MIRQIRYSSGGMAFVRSSRPGAVPPTPGDLLPTTVPDMIAATQLGGETTMCNLFISQDPATYDAETRPVRLHGHVTSIRLEAAFWDILEEIAGTEGMSVARFVSVLHDEILAARGEMANFASFLRVTCLHYLRNTELHARQLAAKRGAAQGAVPSDTNGAVEENSAVVA